MVATAALFFLRSVMLLVGFSCLGLALAYLGLDWNQVGYFFVFVAVGALLRKSEWQPRANGLIGLSCAIAVAMTAFMAARTQVPIKAVWLVPISLAGCYMLFVASDRIDRTGLAPALAYMGRMSLVIYLTHGVFATLVRILGIHLLPVDLAFLLWPACLVAGVAGPLMLARVADRIGVSGLLGFRPIRVLAP